MEKGGGTRVKSDRIREGKGRCTCTCPLYVTNICIMYMYMNLLIFGSVLRRLVGNEKMSYRISVLSDSTVAAGPVLVGTLDQT